MELGGLMQYDRQTPISEIDVYYVFQNTIKGRILEHTLLSVLKQMKQATFDRIIKKI